ncbi:hypothetical protein NI25_36390 [Streptomyces sp. CCM_MD2014]|nr:hypothetical protein NI25_36390 [Streptomyces sp. CCM_MD2014]
MGAREPGTVVGIDNIVCHSSCARAKVRQGIDNMMSLYTVITFLARRRLWRAGMTAGAVT